MIWVDGRLVDWDDATVHVLTHGLHYGYGVLEGIRAYATPRGPAVFRLTDHLVRLHRSARMLALELPYSVEELVEAVKETVRANGATSCYIRPIAFTGDIDVRLDTLGCVVTTAIAVWDWPNYLGDKADEHGIRLLTSSWRRHGPNAIPPACKATGAYVNSSLAKMEAIRSGYDEAIMLSPDGYISECTAENVFVVRDGRIVTPPTSAGALEGVTQRTIAAIARDMGFDCSSANLLRSDLYTADEAFVTGTAAEVVPIRSVDDRDLGEPGVVTRKLQEVYRAATVGALDRYSGWNEYVYGADRSWSPEAPGSAGSSPLPAGAPTQAATENSESWIVSP